MVKLTRHQLSESKHPAQLTQVGDAALAVPPHQDVAALEVAVGDGGLALRAEDLRVKVH